MNAMQVAQTLPRIRCSATVDKGMGDYGRLFPVDCGQSIGVRSFVTAAGLRVGYCAIDGHETSVRRQFAERVVAPVDPHEAHVASGVADGDCRDCERAWETWNLAGAW